MRAGISGAQTRWALRLSFLLVALAAAAVSAASDGHSSTFYDSFGWTPEQIRPVDLHGAQAVSADDCALVPAGGGYMLPVKLLHYVVDPGKRVKSVRVVAERWERLGGGFTVDGWDRAADLWRSEEWKRSLSGASKSYESGSWYPGEVVVYAGGGYLRGRRVEGFRIAPVRYRAQGGELEYLRGLEIEVELEDARSGDGAPTGAVKVSRAIKGVESEIDAMLGGLTRRRMGASHGAWLESEGVRLEEDDADIEGGFIPSLLPDVDGSAVEYVIVTNEEMAGEFERLAEWKTSKGVRAVVKTVEWIESNYPNGVDLAETIRFFLQDAYANWGTLWVLLAGDTDVVPIRYVLNTYNNPGGAEIPTDIYYSCLEGDWNDDGDQFFGEGYKSGAPGDSVDLYPDLFIGRVPANTISEAQDYIDKLLLYEQAPDLQKAGKALYFAEVLFPADWEGGEPNFDGCTVAETAISHLPSTMDYVKLYENLGNPNCPGGLLETKEAVIDSLDYGYGLAHHVGHGFINVMSVGDGTLLNADASGLTNGSMPSFVIALNCDAAAVDYNCIAESFLFNPTGGAVGYLGSDREDYPFTSQSYNEVLYTVLFDDGVFNAGKAFALHRVPFIPYSDSDNVDRWTQMVHILLGEPEMEIWSASPKTLTVLHDTQMTLGETTFDVTVEHEGSPIDSAFVALEKEGEAYSTGYTDAFGAISLPFTPDSLGYFTITVTEHDYIPYADSAEVVTTTFAHMHVTETQVDDDDTGSSSGNGDGIPDRGESIELYLPLKNQGSSTAYSVTAIISTGDTMVTIIDNSSDYGDVSPNNSAVGTGYVIDISTLSPDRHLVDFDVSISSSSGSWSDEAILEIGAPDIELYFSAKDDSTGAGNGDGEVDPLEDIYLYLTLRNNGTGTVSGLHALLRGIPEYGVSLVDSTSDFGNLGPGESFTGDPFMFTNGDSANPVFTLLLNDDHGTLDSLEIDMAPPASITDISGTGGPSRVLLRWSPGSEDDLRGYNVYRSDFETGPFSRVNDFTLETASRYEDTGLGALVPYFFKIAAQDTSGNQGPLSEMIEVSTAPPVLEGWPVSVSVESPSSPIVADIDRDGDYEVCFGGEEIYILHHDGTELLDGDGDVRTLGVFSNTGLTQIHGFWSSPAVADVDRDADMEIVANHMDGELMYLWESDGSVAPGWPKYVGPVPWSSPAIGDIDGDYELEIVTASGNKNIYAWNPDGTEVVDGDSNPGTDGVLAVMTRSYNYGSPALADLDNDGIKEIIFGGRDKYLYVWKGDGSSFSGTFPLWLNAQVTTAPAVADVDNDSEPEIVIAAGDQNAWTGAMLVHVYNLDGSEVGGWPKSADISKDTNCSPAIGDIDRNGLVDIVFGDSDGFVYAWEGSTGTSLPGWPIQTEAGQLGQSNRYIRAPATLADVDGDGFLEAFLGDEGGVVYGFNHDATPLPGFPMKLGDRVRGGVGLWDVDQDGLTDIVAQSYDKNVYIWTYSGAFSPDTSSVPWPFFKRNGRRTSSFEINPLVAADTPVLNLSYETAGVELIWDVPALADDLAGWNVYRTDGERLYAGKKLDRVPEEFSIVNDELIGVTGARSMAFLDSSVRPGHVYTYLVEQVSLEGSDLIGPNSITAGMRGVTVAFLGQNYPNPFGMDTSIPYFIASPGAEIGLSVFDVKGRLVRKLLEGWAKPGGASVNWDGLDEHGRTLPSGLYFYQLKVGDRTWNRKMVLIR